MSTRRPPILVSYIIIMNPIQTKGYSVSTDKALELPCENDRGLSNLSNVDLVDTNDPLEYFIILVSLFIKLYKRTVSKDILSWLSNSCFTALFQ
jgi:hypothetical protein